MANNIIIKDIALFGKVSQSAIFKDEAGSVFVLTKFMEIYHYGGSTFGCFCWDRKTYLQLKKMGVIFHDLVTDDKLYVFRIDRSNLPLLFELGRFKRRPSAKGRWIQSKEKLLGHKILPVKFRADVLKQARESRAVQVRNITSNARQFLSSN